MGVRGKDKSGAPPVQGLLEQITSPTQTPDRSRVCITLCYIIKGKLSAFKNKYRYIYRHHATELFLKMH